MATSCPSLSVPNDETVQYNEPFATQFEFHADDPDPGADGWQLRYQVDGGAFVTSAVLFLVQDYLTAVIGAGHEVLAQARWTFTGCPSGEWGDVADIFT